MGGRKTLESPPGSHWGLWLVHLGACAHDLHRLLWTTELGVKGDICQLQKPGQSKGLCLKNPSHQLLVNEAASLEMLSRPKPQMSFHLWGVVNNFGVKGVLALIHCRNTKPLFIDCSVYLALKSLLKEIGLTHSLCISCLFATISFSKVIKFL